MKKLLIQFIRRKELQWLWERFHHNSIIAMNFWGGANFSSSGEIHVMKYVMSRLKDRPDDIILFDVGAHSGLYALEALRQFRKGTRIHCFEPSPVSFKKLEDLTKGFEDILTYNIGFGEKAETLKLYSNRNGSALASLSKPTMAHFPYKEVHIESVCIETVDQFCKDRKVEEVDFIKIAPRF